MHTNRQLKIVADRNIPFIDTALRGLGETLYLPATPSLPKASATPTYC